MSLVRVVGKGRTTALASDELAELRSGYASTAVDVGTGDGHFAYHLASVDPDRLVIGMDALEEPMGEIAAKAARKPAKGGRANVLYVRAAVEELPLELAAIATELFVVLPWGRLLEGIVLAQDDVLSGLAALCRPRARVSVTLNGEIWVESTPTRYAGLPVPSPEHVVEVVAPGFARFGIELQAARELTAEEAKQLPTTWARRLGHGRAHPRFVQLDGVAASRTGGR